MAAAISGIMPGASLRRRAGHSLRRRSKRASISSTPQTAIHSATVKKSSAGRSSSLRRLGMDYVDLYQIHRFDHDTPIEEMLEALHDVVKADVEDQRRIEPRHLAEHNRFGRCQIVDRNEMVGDELHPAAITEA